jgi:hypothetical protein
MMALMDLRASADPSEGSRRRRSARVFAGGGGGGNLIRLDGGGGWGDVGASFIV